MGRVTLGPSPLAGRSKAYLITVAVTAILAITGAAMAAAPQQGGGRTVMAEFKNVGPITNSSAVRIGGTDVGTNGAPRIDAEREIVVMPLNLNAKAFPLYKNARVRIDQLSLIGEKYVELSPGTPDAGVLPPGEPIPVSQTSLANDYQNLVQVLNDPTAAGLASLVSNLGQGVAGGRGINVQQIIQRLQPAFGEADKLAASLDRQNGILGQIVDQVQPLINGLADQQGRTLNRTVDSATALLGTTAVNERDLQATLRELPSTLAAAQNALQDVTNAAREGEITLRDARPTTDNLAAISRELQGFTDAANPALKSLNPFLERVDKLLDQARPLAAELRRTGEPLYDTIRFLRPVTTSLTQNIGGPYGKGPDTFCGTGPNPAAPPPAENCLDPRVQGLLGFIHNFALATNQGDGLSHYIRIFATLQPPTGVNPPSCPPELTNFDPCGPVPGEYPGAKDGDKQGDKRKDDKRDDKGDNGKSASTNTALGAALPGANDTITKGETAAGGSATGLNKTQEQNALGYLMGGR